MAIRSRTTRRWLIGLAVGAFAVAHVATLLSAGVPYVAPLALIVTCLIAWEFGWRASLIWVALFHAVLPCVLTLLGHGLLIVFADVRGFMVIMMVSNLVAQMVLAYLTARLRALTGRLRDSESALLEANENLQGALAEVKELQGFLPICAWCNDVRDVSGNWERLEQYVRRHSRATFTHSICPKCMAAQLGERS
jgi:hypothetical protein